MNKMDDMVGVSTAATPSPYEIEHKSWTATYKAFYECWSELGRSLIYMNYLHDGIDWEPQKTRVEALCKELGGAWKNQAFYENLLKRIQDEVKNQC